jgi:predicted nucleic acid-binding protein
MSDKILIDTNILVYIYDSFDPYKQQKAYTVVEQAIQTTQAVITPQIIKEFFQATTRSRRQLLTPTEAINSIRNYLNACQVLEITKLITLEAIRGVEIHSLSFWDAQIWATARLNQISQIYSEDFNTGAVIEGVKFVNPLI